jgi:hypothetical protein
MVVVIVGFSSVVNSWVGIRDRKSLVQVERIGYKLWDDEKKMKFEIIL